MSKAAELANLIGNINAGGGGVGRNFFINGAMNVAQRGTSSTGLGTTAGYYTTDRWHLALNSNTAGRLTMTQDSSAPSGFANSTKLACTTADTSIASGEQVIFQQKIEGQNLQTLAKGTSDAKPLALSFYVKGNASATYVAALYEGDNSRYVGKTFSVTTDWTRVEITFPADTTGALDDDNASSLELWIWLHAGSTYKGGTLPLTWASYSNANAAEGADSFFDSTARTFFITGVQLEVGQNPTEFEHEPFAVTLEKCQRYFQVNDVGAEHLPVIRESDDLKRTTVHYLTRMRSNSPSLTLTTTTLDSAALSVDEARETGASIIMSSGSDGNTPKIHVYTVEDEL
tara:strand:+ start:1021 stop:2052 length:1032 start_codon:yes stop_codon:yes gene_type:complete